MTGVIATIPKFSFSANGVPMVSGTLTVYLAGTTTPTDTWQDSALTTLNTNPVTLDARGECVLWLDSTKSYKFVLKNAAGVTQWTQDNISGADAHLRGDLAASSGASLVGYLPSGTGAAETTVQAKLRESVSVKDFGAVGDGVTDDTAAINAAIAWVGSVGGGDIVFPAGVFNVSSTVDVKYPRVRLIGVGGNSFSDAGPSGVFASLSATFAGTLLKIRTPYAAEQGVAVANANKHWGAGAVGITLVGNDLATKALEIDSVAGIEVDVYATGFVGATVYEIKCGNSGTDLGVPCDVQFSKVNLRARQIDSVAQSACRILTVTPSSSGNANVSLNRLPSYGISVYAQHKNGTCFYGAGGDNNDFSITAIRASGGTGDTIFLEGATDANPVGFSANRFFYVQGSGAIYSQGTDTPGVTAGRWNEVWIDDGNATPYPTAGTGAQWTYHSCDHGTTSRGDYLKAVFADGQASATAQRLILGSETMRIYNGSGNHTRYTDGTTEWGIGFNGGDLRILRISGTGAVDVGGGSPVKIGNKLITEGVVDSGGAGYRVLRVPN